MKFIINRNYTYLLLYKKNSFKIIIMRQKVFIILAILSLSQLLISCCDCDPTLTYENTYKDVTIIPYDISGYNTVIAEDTVYRNAFGLGISVGFDSKVYANTTFSISSLGFSSAQAFSCDCLGDQYLYPDPIDYINIYIDDQQTTDRIDVTHCFEINSYSGETIALPDFFEQRESWHDGFQIRLVKHEQIPNSVVFIAEVFLVSGKTLTNQTEIVNFFE